MADTWGPAAVTDGAGPKSQQDKERGEKLPTSAWPAIAEDEARVFFLSYLFYFKANFKSF